MSARARNSLSTCTHVAFSLLIVVKVNPTYIISMQLHDAFVSCSTFFGLLFCSAGLADPLLSKMARCGKTRTDSHICRNLHRTVRSFGKDLPVSIHSFDNPFAEEKKDSCSTSSLASIQLGGNHIQLRWALPYAGKGLE